MATEPKAEAKQEAKTEAEEVVIEGNIEPPLKYKTWVLKVSVHCEGCKRKVKKILKNIDGVYTADVDLRQQKATVTGNVDADTLIEKLIKKTGKHAGLWPEKTDNNQKQKKKGKAKNKNKQKQSDQESSNEEGGDDENEKEVTFKTEVVKIQDPSPKHGENGSPNKNSDCGGHVVGKAGEGGGVQVKEVKISEVSAKQTVNSPAGGHSPMADKKLGGESEVVAEKSGGGGGSGGGGSGGKKKKKKNKGHKGNNTNNNDVDEGKHSGHPPAGTGSPIHGHVQAQIPHLANQSPPRHHHVYDYATTYHAPPVYAVSSNVAHPSTSYGASYYSPQYSYAYMHPGTHPHPGTMSEPPPSDFHAYPSQPSSFEIFSDENPNACSIM